jgi:hypothetical protein
MADDEPTPAPRGRAVLRRAGRVLLPAAGLGAIVYLLDRTGWEAISAAFARIGTQGALLVLALGLGEILLDAEALRRAMLGRVGRAYTLASNSAGALVNLAIPFEAGEVIKGALLRRRSGSSRVLSGLVIWNYVWKLSKPSLALMAFGVAAVLGHAFAPRLFWPVLGGVALSFVPYGSLRVLIRLRPAERGTRLLGRLPFLRRNAPGWAEAARRLDSEVRQFWAQHPRDFLMVFSLQFLARLSVLLTVATLAHRLGLPADPGSLAFLYAAITAADYVTMLVPARLGVSEGATYLLFQLLGVDPGLGLVMAVTLRLRAAIVQAPFAAALLVSPAEAHAPRPAAER